MIDELAHAGSEHLDADFVAGYDRKQGDVPDTDAASDIAALHGAGVGPGATVVDLGAGTGRFALAAAPHVARVVAVDLSAQMLRVAATRATDAGVTNIEFVQAGFLSYEHNSAAVDAVHTRNALHQLPDFWKALALQRIAGIVRPGGVLRLRDLVYDFRPDEAEDIFEGWFGRAADDPARGYTADDFATHIRTEHSTFRWLLEPMLDAAGFDIVDVAYRSRVYAAYTCVRR